MHHVSLCGAFKRVTRQKKTENWKTGKPDSDSTETNSSGERGTQVDEKQDLKSMLVDAKDSVLLQTVTAKLSNPECPSHAMTSKILLDGGSRRSYLKMKARKRLKLPNLELSHFELELLGINR